MWSRCGLVLGARDFAKKFLEAKKKLKLLEHKQKILDAETSKEKEEQKFWNNEEKKEMEWYLDLCEKTNVSLPLELSWQDFQKLSSANKEFIGGAGSILLENKRFIEDMKNDKVKSFDSYQTWHLNILLCLSQEKDEILLDTYLAKPQEILIFNPSPQLKKTAKIFYKKINQRFPKKDDLIIKLVQQKHKIEEQYFKEVVNAVLGKTPSKRHTR